MSDNRTYAMGALAPSEFEWQMGKTAATIDMVSTLENMSDAEAKAFVITALKDGRLTVRIGVHETLDR